MKVVLLASGAPPNPTTGGGPVTAWAVMMQLLELGHDVSVVVLVDPEHYDPADRALADREAAVRAHGVKLVTIESAASSFYEGVSRSLRARLARAWRPPDEELFPTLVDRDAVHDAVASTGAETAFVYHFEMLAASRGLPIPRFAAVGDPPQLSALYRFRRLLPHPRALRAIVRLQGQLRHQPGLLVRMLNECAACGAFAAHHAQWLRERGAAGCLYLHTPVPDPGPVVHTGGDVPTILLVGHFKGVVTLEGLELFARRILPALERELGPEGFEVRIAGGYDPPRELAGLLDRPAVRLLGHVDEAGAEFRRADVMLVPNSIPLGIRVRIVTALSYGTCVVTHSANRRGIPELEHERNALVGQSPDDLVRETVRAVRDEALRRTVGARGRETYDRSFRPDVAVGHIADALDRIRAPARADALR